MTREKFPKSREQRVRVCEAKIRYNIIADAQKILRDMKNSPGFRDSYKPMVVYCCPVAHEGRHWHIGHLPYYMQISRVKLLLKND